MREEGAPAPSLGAPLHGGDGIKTYVLAMTILRIAQLGRNQPRNYFPDIPISENADSRIRWFIVS